MTFADVQELSDDDAGPLNQKPGTNQTDTSQAAAVKSKPKSAPKPKDLPRKKEPKVKPVKPTETKIDAEHDDDDDDDEQHPHKKPATKSESATSEPGPVKRPAAVMKRPSAKPPGAAAVIKASKYCYHKHQMFGIKVNRKEVMTVGVANTGVFFLKHLMP